MAMLDEAALARLRRLIAAARRFGGRTVASADLINLSESLGLPGRLVIDLAAAKELGQPMVVFTERRSPNRILQQLTPLEGEVAGLVAAGLANKQIAARLGISTATVKDHVHRILEKTGLTSRSRHAPASLSRDPSVHYPSIDGWCDHVKCPTVASANLATGGRHGRGDDRLGPGEARKAR